MKIHVNEFVKRQTAESRFSHFTGTWEELVEQVEANFEDARGYGDLKKRLVEVVVETLRPIRERYNDLMTDLGELDRLLAAGAGRAEAVSGPKLKQMKESMGLVLP